MNVDAATMKVDYFEAQKAYTSYRQTIKDGRATKDDVALARAYHALLRGKKVIDVALALEGAGLDHRGLPKLAIARADWPSVNCFRRDGRFVFTSRPWWHGRTPRGEVGVRVALPPNLDPSGRAQVPIVPPQFRPKGPLDNYHLLFEAVWEPKPTRDPLLLQQIGAADSLLFGVLAAWDLTPLEQAVLRAKL